MNPNKFYERTLLFNDIVNEIIRVESNYSKELNDLNLRLREIIENHKQAINQRLMKEVSRKTMVNKAKIVKNEKIEESKESKKNSLKLNSHSKDDLYVHKEENSLIDKLVSEGLQNLLTFYKNKHKLISTQVTKLGEILSKFSSTQKKYEPEDLSKMEQCCKEFEKTYIKLMKAKKTYFKNMCELEVYFHENEKDKKITNITGGFEKGPIKINANNKEPLSEQGRIEEIAQLRKNYKKYLLRIMRIQKEYIEKIKEIGKDIETFNINENILMFDMLKSFEEGYLSLLKEINNFCLFYEHNKKLIESLNLELSNNLTYDDRIYENYQFDEYIPKFKNIKDQADILVLQKMNESIGFQFDGIKTKISDNEIEDDNIKYQKIDNNFLFLLLLVKFIGGESLLNQKEKDMMINLFNDEKYIVEFLFKLNKIRMNNTIFKQKENFNILIEFFNHIFSKLSLTDEKTHELIKVLMILSETFSIKEGEKKIFLISSMNIPKEIKEAEFWIKYLECEIDIESKNNKDKKYNRYEYIVLISNTTHLNEFCVPKEKIIEIVEYFKSKYKFTDEEYEIIKGQLDI